MSANPSWYDLLDVDESASPDEIRTSWKAAIAELDPSDRRFRVLNQAAEVLLDPEARSEYDQALAQEASAASEEAEPAVVEEVAQQPSRDPVTEPPNDPEPVDDAPARPGPAGWIIAALAVLLAALLGVCTWLWATMPPSDEDVAEATSDAQAAAERGIVAIVSYDYRSLDDDQAKASGFMTDDFKKDYESLFAVIRENAPDSKTIIATEVVGSSIVRSGDDRVQVFLFINTPTLNKNVTEPEVYKNQVTVTMEKVGDDWLVDDLKTSLPTG